MKFVEFYVHCLHSSICKGKGLEFATAGRISFYLETLSNFTCKLRFFWYFESQALSQYLLLALAVERVIALYHPMAVRRWATRRNARYLVAGLVLLSVFDAVPSIFEFSLTQRPGGAPGTLSCLGIYKQVFQMVTLIVFTVLMNNLLPGVTVLVCTLIISYKIKRASKARRHMLPQFGVYTDNRRSPPLLPVPMNNPANGRRILIPSRSMQRQGSRGSVPYLQEMQLAKSVLVLASFEVFMHLTYGLIWSTFALQIFMKAPFVVRGILYSLGSIVTYSMILTCIWNLFIYYFTILVFRTELQRVLHLFCCCCAFRRRRPESALFVNRASFNMAVAELRRTPMLARPRRVATFSSVDSTLPATTAKDQSSSVAFFSETVQ